MSKPTVFAFAFALLAAPVAAWACGYDTSVPSGDLHGCYSVATAHQERPADSEVFQGQSPVSVPINGHMYAYYYVGDYPPGHRWSFDRWVGWRVLGGTTWQLLYAPSTKSGGTLFPGQSHEENEYYPDTPNPPQCTSWGFPYPPYGYEARTHVQARLYKGEGQTNAIADDTVEFHLREP